MQEGSKTLGQSVKINTVSLDVQDGIAKVYRCSQPPPFTEGNSLWISFLKLVVSSTCTNKSKEYSSYIIKHNRLNKSFITFGSYTYFTVKATGR